VERWAASVERKAASERVLEDYITKLKNDGWDFVLSGQLVNLSDQPTCIMMLSITNKSIRIEQYNQNHNLNIEDKFVLSLSDIISLNIARPTVTKKRNCPSLCCRKYK